MKILNLVKLHFEATKTKPKQFHPHYYPSHFHESEILWAARIKLGQMRKLQNQQSLSNNEKPKSLIFFRASECVSLFKWQTYDFPFLAVEKWVLCVVVSMMIPLAIVWSMMTQLYLVFVSTLAKLFLSKKKTQKIVAWMIFGCCNLCAI